MSAAGAASPACLGIIGGSGLYALDALEDIKELDIQSPWGAPSAPLVSGLLDGVRLVFLPRHGQGHRLAPDDINYRANIDCLKRAGVTDILSVSACGSLDPALPPGHAVVVDQFIDRTVSRPASFFGSGCVAHISLADPCCRRLGTLVGETLTAQNIAHRQGGTYLAMEGPQFSTRAESRLYQSWGAQVIGMTNMPEARLAREAEICYQTLAFVTDFDCWREGDAVTVTDVLAVMAQNTAVAKQVITALTPKLRDRAPICPAGCDRALDHAIITAPAARDPNRLKKLDAVAGRVL